MRKLLLVFTIMMVFTLSSCGLFSKTYDEQHTKTIEGADTYVLEVRTEFRINSITDETSFYLYSDNVNEVLCLTQTNPVVYEGTSDTDIECLSYITEFEGDLYTIYDTVMYLYQDNDVDGLLEEATIEVDFMNMFGDIEVEENDDNEIIFEKEMKLSDIPQDYVDMFDFNDITGFEDVFVDVKGVFNTETEYFDYFEIDYSQFMRDFFSGIGYDVDIEYVKLVLDYDHVDMDFDLELDFDNYEIDDHPNDLIDGGVVGVKELILGEELTATLENELDEDVFFVKTDGGTVTVTLNDVEGSSNMQFRIIYNGLNNLEETILNSNNDFTHTFEFSVVEGGFYIQFDSYLTTSFPIEYTFTVEVN